MHSISLIICIRARVVDLCIKLNDFPLVISILVHVEEVWLHCAFLRVANDGHVCQRVIEQLCMSICNAEGNIFDQFGSLLAQRHVVEVDLRVSGNEEVEVIAENKRESQDSLGLLKVHLDLLSLLFLEKEEIDLRLANLHGHAILARVH